MSPDYLAFLSALAVALALGSSVLAAFGGKSRAVSVVLVFVLIGASGLAAVVAGGGAVLADTILRAELPLGLPWLHWHMRLDPLAGFFLALIGVVSVAVSLFGPGYAREYEHGPYSLRVLGLTTGLFLAGMQMVVLADDAFSFMIVWELMSLSSYFLVAYLHHQAANRRAAFLYLLMAQIGAVLILLAFGVLASFGGDFTFDHMRGSSLNLAWSTVAFTLALTGFGMKAGLVPLHVWLPDAHPVAPSHISALMSGVMLKVAVYGFIRVSFDLLGEVHWGWGVVLLCVGSVTAIYGVLHALVQNDLKRVLAYSSVENIGVIFIALGLAAIFFGTGLPSLGVLGLVAALFHVLNHALFKSLLFLGAGAVLQHTHERDLDRMGGLIRRMPWTGFCFLVGCVSISALPPFNGFVSEWLTFQTALQAPALDSGVLRAIIPMTAAMLALTGALTAACFVKVYGVAFLGHARSRHARHAREASPGMRCAQGFLAGLCLLFGVLPTVTVDFIGRVTASLTGQSLVSATRHGWLWLTPVAPERASYSAPLILVGILIAVFLWFVLRRRRRQVRGDLVRVDPWDCGFGSLSPRMQYSATAFAMPIRQIFGPVWRIKEESVRVMDERLPTRAAELRYQVYAEDLAWVWLYRPVGDLVNGVARQVSRIQTGHLRDYLAYSFFTLIALLWLTT